MFRTTFPTLHLSCAVIVLAAPLFAQSTTAWTRVVRGCTHPAPPDSLRPKPLDPVVFTPNANDLFAIEIESAPLVSSWVAETRHPGFTGDSYYRWNGPDHFSRAGNGILTYRLSVVTAGTYQVRLHNRHDHNDSSLENDCWIRANGSSWIKAYSNNNRNQFVWNWHTNFDPGHTPVQYRLNAGLNTIEISARSRNFKLDRFHVYPGTVQNPLDLRIPESQRLSSRPIVGRTFDVLFDDPTDAANLTPNQTAAVWLLHDAPFAPNDCGLILPGFGPNGSNGEFLLSVARMPIVVPPLPWNGSAIHLPIRIPTQQTLIGILVRTQAVFVDSSPRASSPTVLTDRLDFLVGDR